jgi:hypothetical protein
VKFIKELPDRKRGPGVFRNVIVNLRKRPGEWADITEDVKAASRAKDPLLSAYQSLPPQGFETAFRTDKDGKRLYARAVEG